jgi:hypothetical protein
MVFAWQTHCMVWMIHLIFSLDNWHSTVRAMRSGALTAMLLVSELRETHERTPDGDDATEGEGGEIQDDAEPVGRAAR